MPDAFECVSDASPLIADITALLDEIKNHPTAVLAIIADVEKISQELTTIMPTCSKLSQEGKDFFANIGKHFTNSTLRNQGFLNILENMSTVTADIQ